jgi:hypothetical protein
MIRWTTTIGFFFVVLTASTAYAQPSDSHAWAEHLFEEGRALRREGKLAEACERFAASQKLDPAVGTLLNYGDCSEKLDRIATAWATYKEAAALARVKADGREKQAADSANRLEPRLSYLTIRVGERVPDLVVKRGDDVIPDKAWGIALPVDGGTYTIRAHAPERTPFTKEVVIPVAQGAVIVDVPPLQREAVGEPPPEPPPTITKVDAPPNNQPPPSDKDEARQAAPNHVPAFVAFGIGALGIGVGTFFALRASDQWSSAKGGCDSANRCNDSSYGLARDAHDNGNVATASFVIGAAGVAAGALLWFLVRGEHP